MKISDTFVFYMSASTECLDIKIIHVLWSALVQEIATPLSDMKINLKVKVTYYNYTVVNL